MSDLSMDRSSALVVDAVADLASRLGIEVHTITVVEARAVTWGDRSYGCPQPGMHYLQRPVDGALVVLEVAGRRYEYHGGTPLRLCTTPRPPSGSTTTTGHPRSV